jgi:hypothetical protein
MLLMLNVKRPMPHSSLRSQSGSFWLGAFMIAEAPVGLVISFLDTDRRCAVVDYVFSSPLAFVCALIVLASLGLFAGWLGHRLGFGE